MSAGVAQLKHEVIACSAYILIGCTLISQGSQQQVVVAGAVAGLVSRYVVWCGAYRVSCRADFSCPAS
jgi:uncharacterized membrane protein YjjP (DUF1212 family)